MSWKEVTIMQEKIRFIELYHEWSGNFKQLCREFGISTKTGYKYLDRYKLNGLEGLQAQSRRPNNFPNQISKENEGIILNTRQLHPSCAGEKIRHFLLRKGYDTLPCEKTIDRILKRYGLITFEESQKHKAWIRFEHENPNDLWQMD